MIPEEKPFVFDLDHKLLLVFILSAFFSVIYVHLRAATLVLKGHNYKVSGFVVYKIQDKEMLIPVYEEVLPK